MILQRRCHGLNSKMSLFSAKMKTPSKGRGERGVPNNRGQRGLGPQNHLLRLKAIAMPPETIRIKSHAAGYPHRQESSGMYSKFIP